MQALIPRCIAGEDSAWNEMGRYLIDMVDLIGLRNHIPQEVRADLVSAVYHRLRSSLSRYNGQATFYRWVNTMVVRVYVDYLRYERSYQSKVSPCGLALESEDGHELPILCAALRVASAEEEAIDREQEARILSFIGDMPDYYSTAIDLAILQGMDYASIARLTQTTIGTVRSRVHRGRQWLRKYILAAQREALACEGR
jgi:RNA polymerase sigma-70 factor (ECF subfamily)